MLSYSYNIFMIYNIWYISIPSDDRILRINGEDVSDSPRDRVIEAIRGCEERILLTVCQPANLKRAVNGGGGGGGINGSPSSTNQTTMTNGTGTNQKSSFMTEVRRSSRFKSRGRPLRSQCVHRVRWHGRYVLRLKWRESLNLTTLFFSYKNMLFFSEARCSYF